MDINIKWGMKPNSSRMMLIIRNVSPTPFWRAWAELQPSVVTPALGPAALGREWRPRAGVSAHARQKGVGVPQKCMQPREIARTNRRVEFRHGPVSSGQVKNGDPKLLQN